MALRNFGDAESSLDVFLQIASDNESLDQGQSHSMSFISDANVLALHRLLWNHQVTLASALNEWSEVFY